MIIDEDFKFLGLKKTCTIQELESAFKKNLKKYHPNSLGANKEDSNSLIYKNLYEKTLKSKKNILKFLVLKKNAYKEITAGEIENKIECRCGSEYEIEKGETLVECDFCSCYVVII